MRRTDAEKDATLDDHEVRIKRVEGRMQSFADAELAYRQATDTVKQLRAEHADEHRKMLSSAKNILDGAVTKAIEPFKEPLAVVAEIRKGQEARLAVEEHVAEQRIASNKRRNQVIKLAVTFTGLVVALAELVRAFR